MPYKEKICVYCKQAFLPASGIAKFCLECSRTLKNQGSEGIKRLQRKQTKSTRLPSSKVCECGAKFIKRGTSSKRCISCQKLIKPRRSEWSKEKARRRNREHGRKQREDPVKRAERNRKAKDWRDSPEGRLKKIKYERAKNRQRTAEKQFEQFTQLINELKRITKELGNGENSNRNAG